MNKLCFVTGALLLAGCQSATDDLDPLDAGTPTAVELGPLVDRIGRPAVAEALVEPFGDPTLHAMMVSAGYGEADPSRWPGALSEPIARSLAVYDALDGVCGNQLLASGSGADRYTPLANLLADDRLWIDTRVGTCHRYLAVEAHAAGLADADDCGGRTPDMDVMDTTLSVLTRGTLEGVSDGVPADPDGPPSADFPFIRAPGR
jgi:hypothetical protein